MIIKNFIEDELDYFRQKCHFIGLEKDLFERRASGHTLEEASEELNISIDCARKISLKVNEKINRVLNQ